MWLSFKADHSSRMRGTLPPLPQYVFMAWCVVKHRDNFTFTFKLVCGYPLAHQSALLPTPGWGGLRAEKADLYTSLRYRVGVWLIISIDV
jgi:hypothetical protein